MQSIVSLVTIYRHAVGMFACFRNYLHDKKAKWRLRHCILYNNIFRNWDHICVVQKDKAVPVHSMKAYTVSRGTAPLILNLGTKWRCVVNIKFRRVIPGKEPRYPLKRGLGVP
jgi:hypothetical protein